MNELFVQHKIKLGIVAVLLLAISYFSTNVALVLSGIIQIAFFVYLVKFLYRTIKKLDKGDVVFKLVTSLVLSVYSIICVAAFAPPSEKSYNDKSNIATTQTVVANKETKVEKKVEKKDDEIKQSNTSKRISRDAKISPKAANKLEKIIEDCKFRNWSIRREADLDGYKDNYDNKAAIIDEADLTRIIVYTNKDDIVAVRYSGYNLYADEKVNYNKYNFIFPSDKEAEAVTRTKILLENYLISPDSAEYSWDWKEWHFEKSPKQVTVSSYVKSKNEYGTVLRGTFTVYFDQEITRPIGLVFNGRRVM